MQYCETLTNLADFEASTYTTSRSLAMYLMLSPWRFMAT